MEYKKGLKKKGKKIQTSFVITVMQIERLWFNFSLFLKKLFLKIKLID